MKKYDILSDYCTLECEPGVQIPVDLVSSGQAELDRQNAAIVTARWKEVWPSTFALLREMRKQYDFETSFTPAGLRAKLMLASSDLSKDADWEVSFTITQDGYSEWGVAFNGTAVDPGSSHPYF